MNNMDFVKQRVTSNIIVDWCEKKAINNLLTFNNSFVSSYQKFRFTTQISEKIIPSTNSKKGYWKNGIFTLYEILNNGGNISVSLLISSKGLTNNKRLNSFLKSTMINYCDEVIVIKTWNIFMLNNKLDNLYDNANTLLLASQDVNQPVQIKKLVTGGRFESITNIGQLKNLQIGNGLVCDIVYELYTYQAKGA